MADENQENADDGWSRRKLLGSIATAGVAGAAGAGGTWAYLSDSSETDISFTTGDLEVEANPSSLDFPEVNEETNTAKTTITNEGSLPARQVILQNIGITGDETVAKAMVVKKVSYRGNNITADFQNKINSGGGDISLYDIASYLGNNDFALEGHIGGDGLDPDGSESAELSFTVQVDYSHSGMTEDNMSMSAQVVVLGKQEPRDEPVDTATDTSTSTDSSTPTPTPSDTPSPTSSPTSTPTDTPSN